MLESLRIGIPGEGCTSLPRVKPGWSFVCLACTSSWGAPRVLVCKFHGYKDENSSKLFFFHDSLMDLKKKTGAGGYAQISDCYVAYLLCYGIAGHSLGALMFGILKPNIYRAHLSSFIQLFQKVQLSGWSFGFCIPTGICVFIISSDFDPAQHFSCSVKTLECGQIFLLACRQLRKKVQHNFIGQF